MLIVHVATTSVVWVCVCVHMHMEVLVWARAVVDGELVGFVGAKSAELHKKSGSLCVNNRWKGDNDFADTKKYLLCFFLQSAELVLQCKGEFFLF